MNEYTIFTAIVGQLSVNCYIICNNSTRNCVIIDPGDDYDELNSFMDKNGLLPLAILITHGHYDHINACKGFIEKGVKVYIGHEDYEKCMSDELSLAINHPIKFNSFKPSRKIKENEILEFIGLKFKVIETPGHTKGSLSYITKINNHGIIFSGDTIFRGSYGRYDFYDGNFIELKKSVNKLLSYPKDYTIMCGHYEQTTVMYERTHNELYENGIKYVSLICEGITFESDIADIVRSFAPNIIIDEFGEEIIFKAEISNENLKTSIKYNEISDNYYNSHHNLEYNISTLKRISLIKKLCKIDLYRYLSTFLKVKLPYGSLTGIRPTKLYSDLEIEGELPFEYFTKMFDVDVEKANLVKSIVELQKKYKSNNLKEVDVFVNIPFCTTRCSYCSFISAEYDKVKNKIPEYVNLLIKEIIDVKKIIAEKQLKVRSVYVGGGTPTSLSDKEFKKIIDVIQFNASEYTIEAGRPDTINEFKLDVMKKNNVTRVSVNPQTFNQKTLDKIGRSHTVQEIYAAFNLVKSYGFDVNMDLIAMLPGENFNDFKYSVKSVLDLKPENITVHSLALKRGSKLVELGYENDELKLANEMIDYSHNIIEEMGYKPYYMYRQKYMSGNLENTGYCLSNKPCLYNIDIMEETNTIIACGAGGITKALFTNDRLERHPNPKGLDVYLERGEEIISSKRSFLDRAFSNFSTLSK